MRKLTNIKYFIVLCLLQRCGSPSAPSHVNTIYKTDDRKDYYELDRNSLIAETARASFVLVDVKDIAPAQPGYSRLKGPRFGEKNALCSDERFLMQPTAGLCSGFLIGANIAVTAGHCLDTVANADDLRVVFGYAYHTAGADPLLIDNGNIYSMRTLHARKNDDHGLDFAVFQLDRAVTDRKPIAIDANTNLSIGSPLTIIGHPAGLPLKIAANGSVRSTTKDGIFLADVDSLKGNSGSAVVSSQSGHLAGILVRGSNLNFDYTYDESAHCQRVSVCNDNDASTCEGEDIISTAAFALYIPKFVPRVDVAATVASHRFNVNTPVSVAPRQSASLKITVKDAAAIRSLSLAVQATTEHPSDVVLSLRHPSGKTVLLERPERWDDANLNVVYGEMNATNPSLRDLYGQPSVGEWTLLIENKNKRGTATVTHAALEIFQ